MADFAHQPDHRFGRGFAITGHQPDPVLRAFGYQGVGERTAADPGAGADFLPVEEIDARAERRLDGNVAHQAGLVIKADLVVFALHPVGRAVIAKVVGMGDRLGDGGRAEKIDEGINALVSRIEDPQLKAIVGSGLGIVDPGPLRSLVAHVAHHEREFVVQVEEAVIGDEIAVALALLIVGICREDALVNLEGDHPPAPCRLVPGIGIDLVDWIIIKGLEEAFPHHDRFIGPLQGQPRLGGGTPGCGAHKKNHPRHHQSLVHHYLQITCTQKQFPAGTQSRRERKLKTKNSTQRHGGTTERKNDLL